MINIDGSYASATITGQDDIEVAIVRALVFRFTEFHLISSVGNIQVFDSDCSCAYIL